MHARLIIRCSFLLWYWFEVFVRQFVLPKLESVTFQTKVGNMYQKAKRMTDISKGLANLSNNACLSRVSAFDPCCLQNKSACHCLSSLLQYNVVLHSPWFSCTEPKHNNVNRGRVFHPNVCLSFSRSLAMHYTFDICYPPHVTVRRSPCIPTLPQLPPLVFLQQKLCHTYTYT